MHFWPFIGVTSPDINSRGPPCTTGMWCLSSGPELCSHQWLELYQWNRFSGKLPRLTSKKCGILKPSGRLKRCIYIWMFPKIGVPQIIHVNKVFHYKPSILGYPYFWKHPYTYTTGGCCFWISEALYVSKKHAGRDITPPQLLEAERFGCNFGRIFVEGFEVPTE